MHRGNRRAISRQRSGTPPAQTGGLMKYFLQTACAAALIGLSGNVYAAVNGINYDPVHNPDWETARSGDNFDKMNEIFDQDLTQIKSMGFNTIKTYYSAFCSDVPRCINPAEKAQNHGLKILLGVFEFPDSKDNTKAQVAAAIAAANDSSTASTVIGIVVGNEDMFDDNFPNTPRFTPNYKMQERILADIATIKGQVSVPVTTAQRSTDWCGGSFGAGCDPDRTDSLNSSRSQGRARIPPNNWREYFSILEQNTSTRNVTRRPLLHCWTERSV